MSTLDATHVHELTLDMPRLGSWRADIILEGGAVPAVGSKPALTIGDLSLIGTVTRADLDAPDRPHVIMTGAPGWAKQIAKPLSFQSDAGVRLSTVLAALAAAAGETIQQPSDVVIGEYYEVVASRSSEPATYADALAELVREGVLPPWRVDPDGVTRFGARVGTEVTARATQIARDAGVGMTTYGLDSPAAFRPGNMIDGVPITKLVVHESSSKLQAEVWTLEPKAAPDIKTSIQRMVRAVLPEFVRTYVVAAVRNDKRLDLAPPPDAPHLPEMANVEQWSLGGALVTPAAGTLVLVAFRDSRRTRPIAFAFGPGTPTAAQIDSSGVMKIGEGASAVDVASGTDTLAAGSEARRAVCWGDFAMMPSGAGATPTAVKLIAANLGDVTMPSSPIHVSKVKAQ